MNEEERRQKKNKYSREYARKRYHNDPEWRKRMLQSAKNYKRHIVLKEAIDMMLEKGKKIED